MNHHEIEMTHGCTNHDRQIGRLVQRLHQFSHKPGDEFSIRPFIDILLLLFIPYINYPSAIAPRMFW